MDEALVAATINAAATLGVSDKCGSLEKGKMADMLILNASRCMGRDKTNLMKSKIDINFRAKMLLWQLKYDSLPSFFFSFLVFSGGSILYTNLVVMIRLLGTSLRVSVFSHSKPHLVHVLKFTSHFTNQSLKNHR